MLEEEFPEEEIQSLSKIIEQTLLPYSAIKKSDEIVKDMEEFIFDVMEEHGVYMDDSVLSELSHTIIRLKNNIVDTRAKFAPAA